MTDLLFLAHRIPYPPDKGDKIRSWNFLRHLTGRYRVHLGAFVDDREDRQHASELQRICASVELVDVVPWRRRLRSLTGMATGEALTFPYFADRRMAAWVAMTAHRHRPEVALAFSSGMAPYLQDPGLASARRVVDLVDLDSAKWGDYAATSGGPSAAVCAREARLLASAEVATTGWADAVLLVSAAEVAVLRARVGARPEHVHHVGNGVDIDYFARRDEPDPGALPLLTFTGAMDYRPNIDAVTFFADAVLPRLRRRFGGACFAIVGARPDAAVRRLGRRPGIIVTGRVADVRPWLSQATLVVAPLRIARGVQNKVLEAMSMGCPVLCTPQAACGVDAIPGRDLIVADGADAIADAVVTLLTDAARRRAVGDAARQRMVARYSWQECFGRLEGQLVAGEDVGSDRCRVAA